MTACNTLIAGCKETAIPESVVCIGDSAFHGCSGMESISIPEGVTQIGRSAFHGCTDLESVTIPESVAVIGKEVFARCDKLRAIHMLSKNPSNIAANGSAFHSILNSCTLYVPEGKEKDYRSHHVLGRFKTIVAEKRHMQSS